MERIAQFDVAILGGGPAGCTTALSLRHRGVSRVLVVEAGDYQAWRIGESLPPDSSLLLRQLGVWEDFLQEGHAPCLGSCSAWGSDRPGFNDFLVNPHGHGWHLDRRRFDEFLARKSVECGVELRTTTRFQSARRCAAGFELALVDGAGPTSAVQARFVVDATGPAARFARQAGTLRHVEDRLTCVCGIFDLAAGSKFSRLTILEAVEYGWWYAARIPGDRLVVAVASDPEIVRRDSLHRPDCWRERLRETSHVSPCLTGVLHDHLLVRSAPSFRIGSATGERWLAVGDAASAFDPISSQGIHKALAGGIQAAGAIAGALGGDSSGLSAYGLSVEAAFTAYQRNRDYLYGLEPRWPTAPFWLRRSLHRETTRNAAWQAQDW